MRDTHGLVSSVRCQLCQEAATGKRKRTQNAKFYKAPYRPQYYVDHNTSEVGCLMAEIDIIVVRRCSLLPFNLSLIGRLHMEQLTQSQRSKV
ncbi:hypothetical protein PHMEG_00012755 [Phytophthora megakarya]|uniref:Uncharacterized protein n=1 Tax=Phytophthora megakarya TaxID=4795 RepID=A0A225W8F9_9STRA|nr:hypothetical protein PHMEG_00012755 [Phytophthora megakarya]